MDRRRFIDQSVVAAATMLTGEVCGTMSVEGAPATRAGSGTGAKNSSGALALGIVTMKSVPWKLDSNWQRAEHYVREATRQGAQLVITPEAVLDGYPYCYDKYVTKERLSAIAQKVPDGTYIVRARELSKQLGIYLIFGFLEKDGEDFFNTCIFLSPQGDILGKYRKVQPSDESFITPGRELKPIDTPIGRVGFLICSDRAVPENFRVLGVLGAQMVFLPMDGEGGPDNTQLMRQRAKENLSWIILANTWSCVVVDPGGEIWLEKYATECVTVVNLSPLDFFKSSDPRRFNSLVYRRPDLYGPLTQLYDGPVHYDKDGRPTALEEEQRARCLESLPDQLPDFIVDSSSGSERFRSPREYPFVRGGTATGDGRPAESPKQDKH